MYTACLNLEVSRPELPLDLDSASATVPATGAKAAWDSGGRNSRLSIPGSSVGGFCNHKRNGVSTSALPF